MAFVSAITKQANFVHGVNGALKLNTSGSIFVDAFTNLNKNTPVDYIDNIINKMIKEVHTISDLSNREFAALNIFRMWVHKRHVRDGEKEKLLSYRYFLSLYNMFPETCVKLLSLVFLERLVIGKMGF